MRTSWKVCHVSGFLCLWVVAKRRRWIASVGDMTCWETLSGTGVTLVHSSIQFHTVPHSSTSPRGGARASLPAMAPSKILSHGHGIEITRWLWINRGSCCFLLAYCVKSYGDWWLMINYWWLMVIDGCCVEKCVACWTARKPVVAGFDI